MIQIYNESCLETVQKLSENSVDIVVTSPFYNTIRKTSAVRSVVNAVGNDRYDSRYDVHVDNMSNDEYCNFTLELFNRLDKVLIPNGVILYNLSYGVENTTCMIEAVYKIIMETNFTLADIIIWKKKSALPNNVSTNRLTRAVEFIYVFCRKGESQTFNCNKQLTGFSSTGQAYYENLTNFVVANNNDEPCPLNKATFSTDLVKKLLAMYCNKKKVTVYDPFMGTGTTAVACKELGYDCIGSEISEKQVEWANNRLNKTAFIDTSIPQKNNLWGEITK